MDQAPNILAALPIIAKFLWGCDMGATVVSKHGVHFEVTNFEDEIVISLDGDDKVNAWFSIEQASECVAAIEKAIDAAIFGNIDGLT